MNAISAWSDRAEERTAKSFQILASIKDIKVLGLESVIIRYLQQFRNLEVTAAQRVHFLTMITVATGAFFIQARYSFSPTNILCSCFSN